MFSKISLRILISAFLLSLISASGYGQSIDQRYDMIEATLSDHETIIPDYLFDSLAHQYQDGISGTQVKSGKLVGTSLSLDEKSATANIGIKSFLKRSVFSSIQIAGSSANNFVSLIKDGKYQQTLSIGGVFNIFLHKFSGKAYPYNITLIHDKVLLYRDTFTNKMYNKYDDEDQIQYLYNILQALDDYSYVYNIIVKDMNCSITSDGIKKIDLKYSTVIEKGKTAIDTLIKLGLLSKDFDLDDYDCNSVQVPTIIGKIRGNLDADIIEKRKYVIKSETAFMSAPWRSFNIWWLTIGANYNIAPQPMIDTTLSGKEHYLSTFNNEYLKFSVAGNFSHIRNIGSNFQYTISLVATFSDPRNFAVDSQITITKLSGYSRISPDTVSKSEFTSTGYERVAKRKFTWGLELPVTLLWNNSNVGIDLSIHAGGNDPMGDNVGGRIGFYIPIDIKDDKPVWIEPLFRITNLFEKSGTNFFKDNVAFGFNLSIAITKFAPKAKETP